MTEIKFRPKAQILIQLGDQLIKNEGIALLELIKNSYDADATECEVNLSYLDSEMLGEIVVEDNGVGMSFETIRDVWMQPGNTHKKKQVDEEKKTKLGRLPIGEKGIGRFGIHKLGKEIEIITRSKGNLEVYFKIDWSKFDSNQFLDEIPITIKEREPQKFINSTGTRIQIRNIEQWNKRKFRETYRQIVSLNSPFGGWVI